VCSEVCSWEGDEGLHFYAVGVFLGIGLEFPWRRVV